MCCSDKQKMGKPPTDSSSGRSVSLTWSRIRGWASLLACAGLIGVVWLVWLPRITSGPTMQRIIQRHRAAGIDAGAMVYTELGEVSAVRFEYEGGRPVLRKFSINAAAAGKPED